MSSDTITHWIRHLKAGDPAAAQKLWERYFAKLVGLARKKLLLGCAQRRVADEEDVALSAFDSFCREAAQGRFPLLTDRNNLWGLLIVITARKAFDLIRHERSLKRGRDNVVGEASLLETPGLAEGAEDEEGGLAQIMGRAPSPALAAQMAEDFQLLLDRLPRS